MSEALSVDDTMSERMFRVTRATEHISSVLGIRELQKDRPAQRVMSTEAEAALDDWLASDKHSQALCSLQIARQAGGVAFMAVAPDLLERYEACAEAGISCLELSATSE